MYTTHHLLDWLLYLWLWSVSTHNAHILYFYCSRRSTRSQITQKKYIVLVTMNSSIVYKPSLSSPCWPLFVQSCCFSWPIFDYARILGPYLWLIWNVVSWVFWYHFCGLCKFDYGRCDSFAWPWWKTAGQRHKTTRDKKTKKEKSEYNVNTEGQG